MLEKLLIDKAIYKANGVSSNSKHYFQENAENNIKRTTSLEWNDS